MSPNESQKFISIEDLAKKFPISKSTIYKRTAARDWPHYRIGRRIVFDEQEITDFIFREGRRQPVEG